MQAEEGRLNILVDAPRAVFERLRPVFEAYCENAGPPGAGHKMKLINNALSLGLGERYVASLLEMQEQINGIRIVARASDAPARD